MAAASVPVNLTIALGVPTTSLTNVSTSAAKQAHVSETKSIADFTALCKKLTEPDHDEGETAKPVEDVSHPFQVKPVKDIVIPPVILPVRIIFH